MVKTTDLYWSYKTRTSEKRKKLGNKSFHCSESTRGCCEFIRYTGSDSVISELGIKINYSQIPTLDVINTYGTFKTQKEYVKWWIDFINSLGTYKVKIIEETDDYTAVYCNYDDYVKLKEVGAINSRLLGALTILRFIWTFGGSNIPLLIKFIEDNLKLNPAYSLWLASVIVKYSCNIEYGYLFRADSTANQSLVQIQAFFNDSNNQTVMTSAGNNKSYTSSIFKILNPMYTSAYKYYSRKENTKLKASIEGIVDFIDNKINLIGKNVTVKLSCLSNFTKNKEYNIRSLDFNREKPSIETMDDEFKLSKLPLRFCKIIN